MESLLNSIFQKRRERVFQRLKIRFLKLHKMLWYVLCKTENFQKRAVLTRVKNLIPKYKIRESQKFIRRLTGRNEESMETPVEKEDKSVENFLIRKNVFNKCFWRKRTLKSNFIRLFFKNMVGKIEFVKRICLGKLIENGVEEIDCKEDFGEYEYEEDGVYYEGMEDDMAHVEDDIINGDVEDGLIDGDVEDELIDGDVEDELINGDIEDDLVHVEDDPNREIQDHNMMSKIEETFEESVDDSRLESPIRKINNNLLVDSQVFGLKLSKIQKIGEEHRYIDSETFNFTTQESGRI